MFAAAKGPIKEGAKEVFRTAFAAGKEVAKAAGHGAKEGIKGAVKNTVREEALKAFRGRFLAPGSRSYAEPAFYGSSAGLGAPIMAPIAPPVQTFPAYCACDENPRAQKTHDGKRAMMCHACAPRGMGVGDFKTQYEAGVAPVAPRARPPSAYFAQLAAERGGLVGSVMGMSHLVLRPPNFSRRIRAKSKSKSKSRSRSKSKSGSKNGTRKSGAPSKSKSK
jgi:hypothetical protein